MQQIELNEFATNRKTVTSGIQNACSVTAHKLADIPNVISTSLKECNLIPGFNSSPWSPTTLTYGYPGLICCFSEMHHFFPDQKWDLIAHQCIEKLVEAIKTQGILDSSLYTGYAGICFALDLASKENHLYPRLRKQLHTALLENISTHYLQPIQHFINKSQPVYPYFYDTIAGIIGILTYLLTHANDENTLPSILDILKVLIKLTETTKINGASIPGWFIASKDLPASRGDMSHIQGVFDTGLAHGISGSLAILAKASLKGITVPGQTEAMQRIIFWLKSHRTDVSDYKNVWPGYVHLQNQKEIIPQSSYRDGWCYGAPGIAFSLFLAGCALKDSNLYEYAVKAMESVCERFTNQNTLTCPSICHGLSGLLITVHQMYLATKSEVFLNTSKSISEHILKLYNEKFPIGFKSDMTHNSKHTFIDNPGFLDGTSGIVMSLLFQLSDRPRPWLPIFLIG
jgi:lantibiotic modifying enzyme